MNYLITLISKNSNIIITIGILFATAVTAWYARIQAIYAKYQANKRFNDIKDWVFRQIIERNIDELEKGFDNITPAHEGSITLNELFESIPKKLWYKNWKRQERKFMLLKAIVDLDGEGYIQTYYVSKELAKKHCKHRFGLGAVGFSYENQNRAAIEKLSKSIEKAAK